MPRDGTPQLMPRRRGRPVFGVLVRVVIGLVLVAIVGVAAAALLVDPDSFRPRVEAAVQQATGRALTLGGPLRLSYGLRPSLVAEDITLANMPTGSRPAMLTARRLDITVALLPLLSGRVEIVRLALDRPDILLETDAAGRANWAFAPQGSRAAPSAAPNAPGQPGGGLRLGVGAARIAEGTVTWRNGRTGRSLRLDVPSLDVTEPDAGGSAMLTGALRFGGKAFTLTGETGPLERLFAPDVDATPWPLQFVLDGAGDRLAVRGSVRQPREGTGYALQVDLAATDLAPFAALLPQPPPTLRDVAVSARISDSGKPVPDLGALSVQVSGLDLAHDVAGLAVTRAMIAAPEAGRPVHADVQATWHGTPVHVVADLGSLAQVVAAGLHGGPMAVAARVEAAGAQADIRGSIADWRRMAGLDATLSAHVADLAALAPLAGMGLPAWQDVSLQGAAKGDPHPGGTLALHGLQVAMPQTQLAGDLDLGLAARPTLRGTLAASRLDLDGLLAKIPDAKKPAAPSSQTPSRTRLFSATPIEFAPLRRADIDLRLTAASVQTGGQTYSNVAGHLVLQNGRLVLDPVSGDVPGGKLDGRLTLDAASADPPLALRLHAPALALQPVAAALREPQAISGTAFVDLDMTGHGSSAQAIAATTSGRLGIAMSGGAIDPNLFGGMLRDVFNAAQPLGNALGGRGTLALRCLALRLDARNGVATVAALLLDAGDLQVQGGGAINLGTEQLALRLRPLVKVGPGIVVPVKVEGSLLAPHAAVDAAGAGRTVALGALGGVLAGATGGAALALFGTGNNADACGPALAAARGEAPAPNQAAPAASAAHPPAPASPLQSLGQGLKSANPLDGLRGLLPR